jgi:hypothetical protein
MDISIAKLGVGEGGFAGRTAINPASFGLQNGKKLFYHSKTSKIDKFQ